MKVSLEGLLVDKVTKEVEKDGVKGFKHILRLFQKGTKGTIDVSVSNTVYDKFKDGDTVKLPNVSIGAYQFNGQVGMYAKSEF